MIEIKICFKECELPYPSTQDVNRVGQDSYSTINKKICNNIYIKISKRFTYNNKNCCSWWKYLNYLLNYEHGTGVSWYVHEFIDIVCKIFWLDDRLFGDAQIELLDIDFSL